MKSKEELLRELAILEKEKKTIQEWYAQDKSMMAHLHETRLPQVERHMQELRNQLGRL